jgi:hypothetical protein
VPDIPALFDIDRADQKCDPCLIDADTGEHEASLLRNPPPRSDEWAADLRARDGRRPVAACLEQSQGCGAESLDLAASEAPAPELGTPLIVS